MKPEWMPENTHRIDEAVQEAILAEGFDEGAIAGAKAVLEYLLNLGCYEELLPEKMEAMLKDLEAK